MIGAGNALTMMENSKSKHKKSADMFFSSVSLSLGLGGAIGFYVASPHLLDTVSKRLSPSIVKHIPAQSLSLRSMMVLSSLSAYTYLRYNSKD